jgi:signal transduction histidine kinase
MFTKTEIPLLMKNYIHISAADVSENWSLTSKLQIQDQELRNKSEELKRTISNLHILSKEKEIENAKIRAHDILGQRLTVLLRMIQNEEILDYKLLTSLSKGLIDEIKAEHDEISPLEELQSIQEIFNSIGVDINFKGKLPEDEEQAGLFVDIIREGSANAVRHGFATRINIESEEIKDSYNLVISNVGHTTSDPIIPGSGIKAIRKKVEAQGGNIEITPYPQFTLSVVLPGGGMDV